MQYKGNTRDSRKRGKCTGMKLIMLLLMIVCSGLAVISFTALRELAAVKSPQISSGGEDWQLALVNKWNPMKTDGSEVKTVELANGERVDERIYPQLQSMFDAAREDGVYPIVASGYRTKEEQEKLYNDKITAYMAEGYSEAEAKKETELWVSVPGTSEHQLGLAVDINADGIHSAGYEVYNWLAANSYKYGFINRYPEDKTEITGVEHEPWHYRYVGVEAAAEIHSQGICLEEYLGSVS